MQSPHFLSLLSVCCLLNGASLVGACGDDSGTEDASTIDAQPNLGTFSMSWSISDGSSPVSCSQVGAFSISVTLIPDGGFSGEAESFACSAGTGISRGLKPGLYNVRIDVRASGSRSLLPAPVEIAGFEIVANSDKALAAQDFVIARQGSFSFFVDGRATAGNCADVAAGGAGIVGLSFELKDALGTCANADFVVAAGSQAGGTYSSDCATVPAPLPCIGNDQLVTVSSIVSGAWTMTTRAQKAGPIDCYERVSGFTVAGADLLTEVGALELDLEYSALCDPDFVEPDAGVAP